MIRSVDFISQADAECLPGRPMQPSLAVISITAPSNLLAPDLATFAHILSLEFEDVEVESEPYYEFRFREHHAQAIIEFVAGLHQRVEPIDLVVHCKAGRSRSAAVALYVAATTGAEMPRRRQATEANKLVVKILAEESGIPISRMLMMKQETTILLKHQFSGAKDAQIHVSIDQNAQMIVVAVDDLERGRIPVSLIAEYLVSLPDVAPYDDDTGSGWTCKRTPWHIHIRSGEATYQLVITKRNDVFGGWDYDLRPVKA